ncbi:prepilin-type N-terminal cleavage/methylation domain-containing protein [Thiomicrorhabdus sp. Milos-T2]|uniref:prepilin-type N-terminal cleavage/methylation domain-containing protein n=1 Tax=Thiomicrorhabdus sp. Milos-T2 TaxID=90814 RepID=UPI00057117E3|nr:prepilin-type N-terminal cleavage/methylation domain-containing protein [Thiomicrorhabdus sp. Milos-T2]
MTNRSQRLHRQSGFTMIELMVVVVIMSIVVLVGVMSLGSYSQDILSNQRAKIQSYIKQVADQAVFTQKMYLIAPDQDGLTVFNYVNSQWLQAKQVPIYGWLDGFNVSWQLNETFAKQQQLPRPGWVFWPSGEALKGQITLKSIDTSAGDLEKKTEVTLKWNEVLEFNE